MHNKSHNTDSTPIISVIIPAYNEEGTIKEIINKVLSINLNYEIVAIDDGSSDNTGAILDETASANHEKIKVIHQSNQGKGMAIRRALKEVKGDIVIIQDADLEYDPQDIIKVTEPIINGEADVVYGSRVIGNNPWFNFLYYLGGRFLSVVTNMLYGTGITDEPTCYKAIKTEILRNIDLKCTGFEFCAEVTAKLAKAGYRIKEVPISYNPRSFKEGKKIRIKDGLIALYILLKYKFVK